MRRHPSLLAIHASPRCICLIGRGQEENGLRVPWQPKGGTVHRLAAKPLQRKRVRSPFARGAPRPCIAAALVLRTPKALPCRAALMRRAADGLSTIRGPCARRGWASPLKGEAPWERRPSCRTADAARKALVWLSGVLYVVEMPAGLFRPSVRDWFSGGCVPFVGVRVILFSCAFLSVTMCLRS